ncbi:MAG: cysteine synthase A [Actinomycetota bacterium]
MAWVKNILDTIGNTPLVSIEKMGAGGAIFAKLESFNPGGSVKDRIALSMVEAAEKEKKITEGTVVIEPTSGNTGIGLAIVCAVKGYRLILTMPESMSIERRKLLAALGAEIVLTAPEGGMKGAIEKAKELAGDMENSFICQQFSNPANPAIHQRTTAVEIWEQMQGSVDLLVCGIGTGGTLTGCGRYLKSKNPDISLVAVEPHASPVLSGGKPGPHKIQGIGAGFIPEVLDISLIDKTVTVTEEDAIHTARRLAEEEGILAGISSGAAMWAAMKLAGQEKGNLVVVLPDGGERYLSTQLFNYDSSSQQ